jgi:Na+/melibiose symporter-like transporter
MAATRALDVEYLPAPPARRLPVPTQLLYAAGDVSNSVKTVLASLFGLYFYTTVMGLPASLFGLAAALGLAWDAVIDPYVGHLSDKARSRFGRRHAFLLVGALTMGIGFWASFSPPRGLSHAALFAWLLGTGFLVRTATSIFRVPYLALGAELSRDYDERTSITAVRGILAVMGALAAGGLSFVVFFPNTHAGVDPKLNYAGYPAMGLVFGAVMTGTALIATLGTWSSRGPIDGSGPGPAPIRQPFLRTFAQCLGNRSFRLLFVSFSLFLLGVTTNAALSLHFLTYYAGVTASAALSGFQAAFYVAGLVGLPFWLRVSRRVEKHRLYVMGVLATAVMMFCALFLVGQGRLLGMGNTRALMVGHALVGFFVSILWFVPPALIADVVDENELVTGQRREGAFFGLYSFGHQLAGGAALLITGMLVDRFARLIPGSAAQSPEAVWRIGLLYSVLPAVLLLAAAAAALPYAIGRREVASIQRELDRRRSLP